MDNRTPVTIICPEHGAFQSYPNNHLKGASGCPKCTAYKRHLLYAKTTEQFINEAKLLHGNKYDYSKVTYYNKSTKVCIICPNMENFGRLLVPTWVDMAAQVVVAKIKVYC